jgi:hypothetical protein
MDKELLEGKLNEVNTKRQTALTKLFNANLSLDVAKDQLLLARQQLIRSEVGKLDIGKNEEIREANRALLLEKELLAVKVASKDVALAIYEFDFIKMDWEMYENIVCLI